MGDAFGSWGFPAFDGRLGGGVTVLGMDMVRGLSGFGGSEVFCKPCDSDLNNFCCMLRTLVAMMKERKRGGGVQMHVQHAYIQSFSIVTPSPTLLSISMTSIAFCSKLADIGPVQNHQLRCD